MAVNRYTNFLDSPSVGESQLYDDLTIEFIQFYGMDVKYLPRKEGNMDLVFQEDALRSYPDAVEIEMYLGTAENYGGQGSMMSVFGFEYRDTVELWVSKTRFYQEVGSKFDHVQFPREGDVVFLPLVNGFFEITFADKNAVFMQFGDYYSYKLKCERMRFSSEDIITGDPVVDAIASRAPNTSSDIRNDPQQGNTAIEIEADNETMSDYPINPELFGDSPEIVPDVLQTTPPPGSPTTTTNPMLRGNGVIDFTESDPFSRNRY